MEKLKELYKICGYREKEILKTAKIKDIKLIMKDEYHEVYKIQDGKKENYFEYDVKTKKIVG